MECFAPRTSPATSGRRRLPLANSGSPRARALVNMADLAEIIQAETGVRFRVVGFDTGTGLAAAERLQGSPGTVVRAAISRWATPEKLKARLKGRADLILGNIQDTIEPFTASLTPECPLGFVSIDVDIYCGHCCSLARSDGAGRVLLAGDEFLPRRRQFLLLERRLRGTLRRQRAQYRVSAPSAAHRQKPSGASRRSSSLLVSRKCTFATCSITQPVRRLANEAS